MSFLLLSCLFLGPIHWIWLNKFIYQNSETQQSDILSGLFSCTTCHASMSYRFFLTAKMIALVYYNINNIFYLIHFVFIEQIITSWRFHKTSLAYLFKIPASSGIHHRHDCDFCLTLFSHWVFQIFSHLGITRVSGMWQANWHIICVCQLAERLSTL